MAESVTSSAEWTVEELLKRLDRREDFFILDARAREEFERWKIEGRAPLPIRNEPYFELIELAGSDDPVESARALAAKDSDRPLPEDRPVLTVCAKGGASGFLAEGLRRLGYQAFNLRGGMAAWGDAYTVKAVARSVALAVHQVARIARGCLSYIIVSDGKAAVVDPLRHVDTYLDFLQREGLTLEFAVDTHAHADHVSGGCALAGRAKAPYYLHPYDGIHPMDVMPAAIAYEPLRDGQTLNVGRATLEVIHIPGHTLGNLALRLGHDVLLTGDSIFLDSIARPDLGGRGEAWAALHYRSLRRLLELSDAVAVLPGHFSRMGEADDAGLFAAPLGKLRRANEGLLMAQKSEKEFVDYILRHLPQYPEQYVQIKRVNAGLAPADDEAASELEIGKNVCAMAHER